LICFVLASIEYSPAAAANGIAIRARRNDTGGLEDGGERLACTTASHLHVILRYGAQSRITARLHVQILANPPNGKMNGPRIS
jgi:hypothetical protein